VTDNCDPDPTVILRRITSDEPDNDKGDGNFADDIQNEEIGTPDLCFDLRSERQGGGDGREYCVTYRAQDASGNQSFATVCVDVPHDQGAGGLASTGFIGDGTAFDPAAESFAVIVPGTDLLYASSVELKDVYLGNTAGVARPIESRIVDANLDNRLDLALFFSTSAASALHSPISFGTTGVGEEGLEDAISRNIIPDGPVGIHFVAPDGTNYLVANIFALGPPVPMPTIRVDEPPLDGGKPEVAVVRETGLSSIHPNPFNPQTTVGFRLASSERVRIAIYDVRGTLVRRLVDETMPSGEHRVVWNGTDEAGRSTSSGIYFVRMIVGRYEETRKIVMLK
jgi:hypothetical protein